MARLQLRLQHLTLAVDHVEIAHLAFLILRTRQVRGALRCIHRIVLRAHLVVEQAQVRKIVFDFAERHEHLLTILRDVLVVLRTRLVETRAATAAVEDRHC